MKIIDIFRPGLEMGESGSKDLVPYYGAKDCIFGSKIALPTIILFEAYLIVSWILGYIQNPSAASTGYIVGYILLLSISVIMLIFIFWADRDLKKHYQSVILMQNVYCIFLIIWALSFTYIGGIYRNNFSIIIYVTVLASIPIFCFTDPVFSFFTQGLSAMFVIYIAGKCEVHFRSFMVNFIIFSIISIVASASLYYTRCRSYMRQIRLEILAAENKKIAYTDGLTGLRNRRSYMEDMQTITSDASDTGRRNLILLSADVNGLKNANDTMGHEAGDELLCAAATILQDAFSPYGSVYRVGGDEFYGILRMTSDDLATAQMALKHRMGEWHGRYSGTISISSGFASAADMPDASLKQLEIAADNNMYEAKQSYYHKKNCGCGK